MKKNCIRLPGRKKMLLCVKLVKVLFIIGICYLFLFPILNMLITAFKPLDIAEDPTAIWIPRGFSLEGIKQAIIEMNYWKTLGLTLNITIVSTACSVISCSLAGYGLARFNFPGKTATLIMVMLTIIIPPQIMYSSTYLLYRFFDFGGLLSLFNISFNLLDTAWVFNLPSLFACGLRNGIFIYIFYSFFGGLPIEMEEAAKIDGCGVFKTYRKVMMPLSVPSFITVMLFSIVWNWTEFQNSTIYFTQQIKPIVVMLSKLQNSLYTSGIIESVGQNMYAIRIFLQAGLFLVIIPPLVLYLFTQKYFTESIERTGIVG